MRQKIAIMTILACLSISQAFAHAMWIETAMSGKKGMAQEVKIFFGEFGDNDITPTSKWFSDIKDFSLTLLTPDNKIIKLSATAQPNWYSAYFTPDMEGVYTLTMHHLVKEVYNGMLLDYNSMATVRVGNAQTATTGATNPNMGITPAMKPAYKINEPVPLQVFQAGVAAADKEVEVIAFNGWLRKLYTDSTGAANFTPLWPGKYNLEITSTEKLAGEHHGVKYESKYTCAIFIINVNGTKKE
jgi:hypothetical protein